MKKKSLLFSALFGFSILMLSFSSCKKDDSSPMQSSANPVQSASSGSSSSGTGNRASAGISTAIPAYYDAKLFNILFVEFSAKAAATLLAKNPGINFIYQSDNGLPGGQPFISVIDAIPGDGMNPVWEEVQIVFNGDFTPHQFYSDDEVLNASLGANPEITLTHTGEVYWCPIIGH